eukprot:COSAG02_NODE_974_length_15518_cov_97.334717_11_plen_49_part_00
MSTLRDKVYSLVLMRSNFGQVGNTLFYLQESRKEVKHISVKQKQNGRK